ncbi:MAG TPA: hypothetical protein VHC69_25905 [Polyangiaceae bacterium]|nr:hypothetical protein [Polyangiaceae bacterium]
MRSLGIASGLLLTTLVRAAFAQAGAPSAAPASPSPSPRDEAPAAPATATTPPENTPASDAAPAPGAAPPAPAATNAPPLYYVEPRDEAAPEQQSPLYEPQAPMYVFEPPPPPRPPHQAPPRTALWLGVRAGVMIPFGSLWTDGFNGFYRQRTFHDYASTGPMFQIDVGARLARHYNVFAMWEHGALGQGDLDDKAFGGQEWGATNMYGVGVRFSTDPTGIGFLMEIGLGYRQFTAYWNDGTKLSLTDGWLDAHIGLGVDVRVCRWLSLSPMIVLGGGSFDTATWSGHSKSGNALTPLDEGGEYGVLSFQLGAHADIL